MAIKIAQKADSASIWLPIKEAFIANSLLGAVGTDTNSGLKNSISECIVQ